MLVLRESDIHAAVKQLHQLLNDLIIHPGPHLDEHDDFFGKDTHQAVINFQKQKGLPQTGIVEAQTWTALGQGLPPSAKIDSGPTINYMKNAEGNLPLPLSDHGVQVLKELLREAGEKSCGVSSTYRDAHDQARVMLQNWNHKDEKGEFMKKEKHQYRGKAGKQVFQVYEENVKKDKHHRITNKEALMDIMAAKITEAGFGKGSGHLAHGRDRDTIDIEPSSINNKQKLHEVFLKASTGKGNVIDVYQVPKFLGGTDECYHIEVPYHALKRKDRGKHKVKSQAKRAKHQAK